jgi:hypothetical protein
MWRRGSCAFLLLASCITGPVERQRLADGSWHLTCRLPMDECVRHFEAVCMDKRYRILGGQSRRDLRDVDPGTKEYRTSELTALCERDSAQFAAASAVAPSLPPPPAPPPSASVPRPASCVPGATQACVGPGGCAGGQACRADGSGFGPCDCGGSKSPTGDAGT